MTDKILAWAKANAKADANVAEFEELIKAISLPDTKEKAWDFIQKTPAFKSALDAEISRATAVHDENFKAKKLPELIAAERERLAKELNPEETKEQKELREIREELARAKSEKLMTEKREALRKLATEKSFDPELAAELAVYGEEAEAKLDFFAERFKGQVDAKYEETARLKLGEGKPPASGGDTFDMAKAMPGYLG